MQLLQNTTRTHVDCGLHTFTSVQTRVFKYVNRRIIPVHRRYVKVTHFVQTITQSLDRVTYRWPPIAPGSNGPFHTVVQNCWLVILKTMGKSLQCYNTLWLWKANVCICFVTWDIPEMIHNVPCLLVRCIKACRYNAITSARGIVIDKKNKTSATYSYSIS